MATTETVVTLLDVTSMPAQLACQRLLRLPCQWLTEGSYEFSVWLPVAIEPSREETWKAGASKDIGHCHVSVETARAGPKPTCYGASIGGIRM